MEPTKKSNILRAVGKRISQARRAKGISQAELANRIGTTQQMLSGYEAGKYEMGFILFGKIAACLNISAEYLYVGKAERPVEKEILSIYLRLNDIHKTIFRLFLERFLEYQGAGYDISDEDEVVRHAQEARLKVLFVFVHYEDDRYYHLTRLLRSDFSYYFYPPDIGGYKSIYPIKMLCEQLDNEHLKEALNYVQYLQENNIKDVSQNNYLLSLIGLSETTIIDDDFTNIDDSTRLIDFNLNDFLEWLEKHRENLKKLYGAKLNAQLGLNED